MRAVFSCFHGKKLNFVNFLLHFIAGPSKLEKTLVVDLCVHYQKLGSTTLIFKNFFLHCRVRSKKLLDTKAKKIQKKFGKYLFWVKNCFLGLAVLVL